MTDRGIIALALGREAPDAVIGVLDAGFIAPVNLGPLLLGAGLNLRIDRFLPLGKRLGVLLMGPLDRFLRGEPRRLR